MSETKEEIATGGLMMMQAAQKITPLDAAAFSVLIFSHGEADEEWQQRGVEAFRKFSEFGWAAFHALGGFNTDWNTAAANTMQKLKNGLPKKERKPATKRKSARKKK